MDKNGNQVWKVLRHLPSFDRLKDLAAAIAVDDAGNVCVTGYTADVLAPLTCREHGDRANGKQVWAPLATAQLDPDRQGK